MKPSIGRVVLYWPTKEEMDHEHAQPFPCQIAHIHPGKLSDAEFMTFGECDLIAVGGFTDAGEPFAKRMVPLYDDSESHPGACSWMPYQIQAAATQTTAMEVAMLVDAPAETKEPAPAKPTVTPMPDKKPGKSS